MKLMMAEVCLIRRLVQKATWRGEAFGYLCAYMCLGVGMCAQTPGQAANCYNRYFEVGTDNVVPYAFFLFYLEKNPTHILQLKL